MTRRSLSAHRIFARAFVAGLGALAIAFVSTPLTARADSPTAMTSGPNFGSADSFQGPHDWYFQVRKGPFDLAIVSMGDGHDTVPLNSAFSYKIYFTPHIRPGAYTFKQNAGGFTFHGSVASSTKVVVRIIPATSGLVRVARNYTIEATGDDVAFVTPAADPIVGTYQDMSHGHGAAKFKPDGTILFSDGSTGTWVAFDQSLRIYTVTVGPDRASVKFVPGRGLLDQSGNGNSLFDSAH